MDNNKIEQNISSMNNYYSVQIPVPIGTRIVYENIYNNMVNENNDMKIKILQLYDSERILQQLIETKNKIIDGVKENTEKQKLEAIDNKSLIVKCDILDLKYDNLIMKCNAQEIKLNNLYYGKIIDKFTIAIRCLDRTIESDTFADAQTRTELLKIKEKDTELYGEYYINYKDSSVLKNDKILVLLDKINNIDPEIQKIFDRKYPNLLTDIKKYVVPNTSKKSIQSVIDGIYEWWEE